MQFDCDPIKKMATLLGKRKRQIRDTKPTEEIDGDESSSSSELDAQEVFRRHFEAQFEPLPVVQKIVEAEDSDDEVSGPESEWGGISEVEDTSIEVIEHTDAESRMAAMSKEELKLFMVCSNSACIGYNS
jgi:hypothetical protein